MKNRKEDSMKKLGSEKNQKYSLRKYKGIGAASVLLGMMVVGTVPVLAQENTTQSNENRSSGKVSLDEMITLKNGKASYSVPFWHYHVTDHIGDRSESYAKDQLKHVEEEIRSQGVDSFQDSKVSFVSKEGTALKNEEKIDIPVNEKQIPSTTMDYKIRGRFGKRYEGNFHGLDEKIINKIRESEKILEKDVKTYHKIDTVVDNNGGTSTETTFNDVTIHANPAKLHNEDGSIRYSNIKDGSRVWLVSETSENHYGKYVLATKPETADNTWAIETFKNGENQAKDFTNANVTTEGGIQEGDTVLVVEKNEFAIEDVYGTANTTC